MEKEMKGVSVFPPSAYRARLKSQGGTCAGCTRTKGVNGGKLREFGSRKALFCGSCRADIVNPDRMKRPATSEPNNPATGHAWDCTCSTVCRPCDKKTRKSPCEGVIHFVVCNRPDCASIYRRCEAHGGAAGAQRSLTGHKAMYHPKESR